MKVWKAHYTDEHYDLDIDIFNTEGDYSSNPLSFCIDGIKFAGTGINDFELADAEQYETAKNKFNIFKHESIIQNKAYFNLQRYSLDIKIPINIIRKSDNSLIEGILRICFKYNEYDIQKSQIALNYCDNEEVYPDYISVSEITLSVDNKQFSPEQKNLNFEDILIQLNRIMKDDYLLKCCFMCQWSDYSPYGNDDFGTMQCYKNHREAYLKVNTKDDYFKHLGALDFESMQETFLCGNFTPRTQCEGYRGFVE